MRIVPDGFSRNSLKYQLVERNRLVMVLTTFGTRHVLVSFPALLAIELAMLALALVQGWLPEKLHGYSWLVTHWRWLRDRRRRIQADRKLDDREMARLFTARLDPANMPLPIGAGLADRLLVAYWRIARLYL